ncbi:MAG: YciI family protein [Rhodospirillales bacterium]|jgi:hypothetical protein
MADETPSPVAGFLQKEFYVVFTRPAAPMEEIRKLMPQHLERQLELEEKGILFAAGPLFDASADASERPGTGMIIIRAGSQAEAEQIAGEDPLHKAGLRSFEVKTWKVNEGSYSVTVKYSDQSMEII